MAAATVLDPGTVIPVKQHGFIVKDEPSSAASITTNATTTTTPLTASSASTPLTEPTTIATSSGLTPASLNRTLHPLKATPTMLSTAATAPSTTTLYAISPGLPRVGDMRLADYTHLTPGVKRVMRSVVRGLKAHQDPEAATEGLGGTYFFRNEAGTKIAIMKPCDEEPLAPNNPKGFVGRSLGEPGLKPTVRVGEAASREVAAYLLDHDHFARVPHTVMVRMSHPIFHNKNDNNKNSMTGTSMTTPKTSPDSVHTAGTATALVAATHESQEMADDGDSDAPLPLKLGSLQEFVPHECDTSELGSSRFSVQDVHRIGILDIRLFNTDRHAGNILVRRPTPSAGAGVEAASSAFSDLGLTEKYDLIPIDHGFALPEALEPPYFEWQHWPQAMMPFCKEELEYIAKLDPKADVELLRRELPGLREESLRLLEVSTTLLKKCAAAGLSLAEIANVVTRPLIGLDDDPSELEKICVTAREDADSVFGVNGNQSSSSSKSSDYDDDDDDDDELDDDDAYEYDDDAQRDGAFRESTPFAQRRMDGIIEDGGGEEGDEADKDELIADAYAAALSPTYGVDDALDHQGDAIQEMSSNASRQTASIDDALFSMDEDTTHAASGGTSSLQKMSITVGTASQTLSRTGDAAATDAGAPAGAQAPPPSQSMDALHRRFMVKAPSLVVKRSGEIATPGGIVGASFGSALASSDSLPASYESEDSPSAAPHRINHIGRADDAMSMMVSPSGSSAEKSIAFHGVPSTYVPGGFTMARRKSAATAIVGHHFGGSSSSIGPAVQTQKGRNRMPGTVARPLRKPNTRRTGIKGRLRARGNAYPPLVAPRFTPSSTSNVFCDLTENGWRRFMKSFVGQVDDALSRDVWRQRKGNNEPAPLMSCPKF